MRRRDPIAPAARRPALLAATAMVGALVLAACSGPDGGEGGGGGATTSGPAAGGSITLAVDTDPGCWDPAQSSFSVALSIGAHIVDTLVDQDFETGDIVAGLAESWEIDDTATRFTFHLRDGVTFSDGTALDAEAVKATFDAVRDLGASAALGASYLTDYVETVVEDESTVTIVLGEPNVSFLQAVATPTLGIFSPETNAKPAEERCQLDVVGSGPYVVSDYQEGSQIVLAKREGYDWAPASADHTGEAYLDEIVLPLVTEASVRTGGLQSGEFDGIFQVATQDQDVVEGAGFTLVARPNPGNAQALFANATREITGELAVRQAVQKAIDREEFRATLLNDRYAVASSVLSPTTPGYVDLSDELAYDPDGAGLLLDEAGWTEGADGVRARDGQRLELTLLTSSWARAAAELAQSQLLKVGIASQIEAPESSQYNRIRGEGNWDYAFSGLTRADPDTLRRDYSSTSWPNSAARVPANPIDELLAQQNTLTDQDERRELIERIQRELVEQGFGVPYATNLQIYAVAEDLHDVRLDASSRLRLYDAWVDRS